MLYAFARLLSLSLSLSLASETSSLALSQNFNTATKARLSLSRSSLKFVVPQAGIGRKLRFYTASEPNAEVWCISACLLSVPTRGETTGAMLSNSRYYELGWPCYSAKRENAQYVRRPPRPVAQLRNAFCAHCICDGKVAVRWIRACFLKTGVTRSRLDSHYAELHYCSLTHSA